MIIFSKKNKKKIIGIIFRNKNIKKKRINLCPVSENIQVSTQKLNKNFIIKPHVHINFNSKKINSTQEVWLILKGNAEIKIYDIDKKYLKKINLKDGDMYILLNGGHDMKVKKNTIFYEIKNGPYNPKIKDIQYF